MTIEVRPELLGRMPIPFVLPKKFALGDRFFAADGLSGRQEWVVVSEDSLMLVEGHKLNYSGGAGAIEKGRLFKRKINREHLHLVPTTGESDNSGYTIARLISHIAPEMVHWRKTRKTT